MKWWRIGANFREMDIKILNLEQRVKELETHRTNLEWRNRIPTSSYQSVFSPKISGVKSE